MAILAIRSGRTRGLDAGVMVSDEPVAVAADPRSLSVGSVFAVIASGPAETAPGLTSVV